MKSGSYKKRELRCKDIEQFPNLKESMGGHYAGENYGSADIALQYGGPWDPWSNWNADDKPHLQKNAEKYRKQKHRHEKHPRSRQQSADQPEGKMAETLENTGQASSQNESAGVVSGTFVHCDPWLCHLFFPDVKDRRGASSDLSVCGRHCTSYIIAFASGSGFFLQRRAGDGHADRLCGADEKLGRRDSCCEKSGPRFTGRNRGQDYQQH